MDLIETLLIMELTLFYISGYLVARSLEIPVNLIQLSSAIVCRRTFRCIVTANSLTTTILPSKRYNSAIVKAISNFL